MATWTMRSGTAGIVAAAMLVAASGCAAREAKFASRFVKSGEPSVTFDDPDAKPAPPPDLSDYVRKVRALQSKATPKNSFLPTIESSNPALMNALLLLGMHESPSIIGWRPSRTAKPAFSITHTSIFNGRLFSIPVTPPRTMGWRASGATGACRTWP